MYWNEHVLNVLSKTKSIIKIHFIGFFHFFNVATRKVIIMDVVHIWLVQPWTLLVALASIY